MKKLIILLLSIMLTFSVQAEKKKIKTIKLTTKNHVVLRSEVNNSSVSEISQKLLSLSSKLKKDEPIYFVIDSGGGSVMAGMDMINLMEAIPNPIHTISIFAFSMAYSISQRGDVRYIAKRGIMGQHRAKGGFQGQFATGEVESRLGVWTTIVNQLEDFEAQKMGLTLAEFKNVIINEMYVYDKQAVDKKVADEVVQMLCDERLIKQRIKITQRSFMGSYTQTFSGCPIIRGPVPPSKKQKHEDDE